MADLAKELMAELEYLRFYKQRAYQSFGAADGDIEMSIQTEWEERGNVVPPGHKWED